MPVRTGGSAEPGKSAGRAALYEKGRGVPIVAAAAMRKPILRFRGSLAAAEVGALAAAAPFLLFPGRATAAAVWLVPAGWLLRRRRLGSSVATRQDGPIALLLAATAVALVASFDLAYALPKLCGILFGVAAFYVVALTPTNPRGAGALGSAMSAATIAVSVLGLLGTAWFERKWVGIGSVTARLPSVAALLPHSATMPGVGGIHPNEVAGTLVLLLPVVLVLLTLRGSGTPRPLAAAALGASALVLVLTQSRSGLSGAAVAACFAVGAHSLRRRSAHRSAWLWLTGSFVITGGGVLILWAVGLDRALIWVDSALGDGSSGVSRAELWSRAWLMLRDFPFTGVGLNAFPFVLRDLYPTFLSAPGELIPHAHNIYLQAAMDLGLPGMLAFLALLGTTARSWCLASEARPNWRILSDGAAAGLVGFCVYGLTDAVTLGAKPGIFFWALLGTIAAAERASRCARGVERGPRGEPR